MRLCNEAVKTPARSKSSDAATSSRLEKAEWVSQQEIAVELSKAQHRPVRAEAVRARELKRSLSRSGNA
jgi:hypothetical protein